MNVCNTILSTGLGLKLDKMEKGERREKGKGGRRAKEIEMETDRDRIRDKHRQRHIKQLSINSHLSLLTGLPGYEESLTSVTKATIIHSQPPWPVSQPSLSPWPLSCLLCYCRLFISQHFSRGTEHMERIWILYDCVYCYSIYQLGSQTE